MMLLGTETVEKFKALKTPFFYYDLRVLEDTLNTIKEAVAGDPYVVHYALKANTNERVMQCIRKAGFGVDCVSGNEVKKAIEQGFTADSIAFAGVGKTDKEINYGLQQQLFTFNVESLPELEVIDALAKEQGTIANIAIRLNPNVNANTHHYITTGLEENKFGINYWELDALFALLSQLKNIKLRGLHFHIGSQITDLSVFKNLCNRVNELQQLFNDRGIQLEHINVGGGLGVNYSNPDEQLIPDFKAFFDVFRQFINLQPQQELHFELGRAVVAQCAALISRVLYIKKGIKTNFAILDAGMTELIRPALYQSFHKIQNLSKLAVEDKVKYDVVGPICESSDCFGKAIQLPETERGDLIAIRSVGAYGEVMSSSYNLREKAQAYYHDEI
jgi:diaminopimelate decarboxylase